MTPAIQPLPTSSRLEVRDAIRRMHADLAHCWTLEELAEDVCLSVSRFRGVFVEEMGIAPIALLIQLRVRKMAQLLLDTNEPVYEVARAVGWSDQAHAAKQFRKLTGQSPTEYRVKIRRSAARVCLWCGQPLRIPARRHGDVAEPNGDLP